MRVTAKLNYLHISPRKVRAVVGVVKGLKATDALGQLRFVPNRAALPLFKLVKSAIANAENNFSLESDSLKIAEFKVDGGPVFKRFRPGSRGRVSPLRKKTSHVTLVLEGQRSASPAKKSVESKVEPTQPAAEGEIKVPKADKDAKREDVFKPQHVPAKKRGFVKRIFQRKSI